MQNCRQEAFFPIRHAVRITFDPAKRKATLESRGVDFADAYRVFAGTVVEIPDTRFDYGEERTLTIGLLNGRMMVVVWTPIDAGTRRIISMRKANDREQRRFAERLRED